MLALRTDTGQDDERDSRLRRSGHFAGRESHMTYRDQIESLAPVEYFKIEAFEPDASTPPAVCAFFLSLAVIYDDLKDLVTASSLLSEVVPASTAAPSPERGEFNGFNAHVLRLLGGLIHELLKFVGEHLTTVEEPSFRKALRACPKPSREAWLAIEAAACNQPKDDRLVRALLCVRNKVSFHYDPKEIHRAYRAAFRDSTRYGAPCLSRGRSMRQSRFYFADAAAQEYFSTQTDGLEAKAVFGWDSPIISDVNLALYGLLLAFIQSRGFAFASAAPPA